MNEYIAAFVDEFHQLGVEHAVFSPGSRSTTMSMLFTEHGGFTTYMNVDERSAAFMALGIAKGTRKPVILVCTSGSAMAHYLPALLEAQYSGVPLIVLSADRPHTLQYVGAPQTIDQHKLFGTAVNYYEELAVPKEDHYYTYPRLVARKAYMKSMDVKQGPVHINVPLFEPLVPDLEKIHFEAGRSQFSMTRLGGMSPDIDLMMDYDNPFDEKSFLILAGPNIPLQDRQDILSLAKSLKAPVLADPLSNLRHESDYVHRRRYEYTNERGALDIRPEYKEVYQELCDGFGALLHLEQTITSYDAFLKNKELWDALKPDVIIQFGDMVVSKRAQQFIAYCEDAYYIVVNPTMDYMNPLGTTNWHVQSTPAEFVNEFSASVYDGAFFGCWKYVDIEMRKQLDTSLAEVSNFEGRTIGELQRLMPAGGQVMVANSMSIRDFDYFWEANRSDALIYGNRGVNGIDGTVSTALGLAANGKPTVLVTGDLSLFHDLNGLAVAKTHNLNLTIILHNNDGGGIFEYLPQKGTKHFDYLFSTEQGLEYAGAAQLYGCGYTKITKPEVFSPIFSEAVNTPGVHIIEIPTNKEQSHELHQSYTSFPTSLEDTLSKLKQVYSFYCGNDGTYEATHVGEFYFDSRRED